MPVYNYVGLNKKGEVVKGKVEAANPKEARQNVKELGFLPTKVTTDSSNAPTAGELHTKGHSALQSLTLKEKIDFTSTFLTLNRAGVPIIESLIFMEQDAGSRRIRLLAREIRLQIIAGATFSDTVSRYPEIFGSVYIGLIKAGEESGEMERTLTRLIELLKKESDTRGKVFSALSYPVFVVVLAHVVVLIMLTFVFPVFKEMFDTSGAKLPWVTQVCISAGEFIKARWYLLPIIIITIGWGVYSLFKYEPTRKQIDELMLQIPLIGDLIKNSAFSNFLSVLQVAYEAGIPVVNCLYLANMTFSNSKMNSAVQSAIKKVQEGMHLSMALKTTSIFPQMILFMISTGEQSGRLGDLMEQSVLFIDEELDRIVDAITKMIEPVMLIFIGGIVCFLAAALYLPLFQSYQLN
ncbi:MAG: type II secretion system F family protein [Cyanobacteria bacterium RUI128]|nr:type II secretion system F family protein [Cyanobacteria bacterium RUI128]